MLDSSTLLQNRYRILRQLGKGGMGAVYEAFDERVSCIVALKQTLVETEELRRAFEREAQLLANLSHPALPKVTDHFRETDRQFLVMEYISGTDLAQLMALRGSAFPLPDVLSWADMLLDALEYLHTSPTMIIHRDIKPANIKLTEKNKIYLLDFGLSKGAAGQMATLNASQSVAGGTPNYMPLEQATGFGTDPRSDLYSLAATLYHLLTGVVPPSVTIRLAALKDNQPDPLLANNQSRALPPAVASVLFKAMEIDRNKRPGSAEEMRRMLQDAAGTVSSASSSASTLIMPEQNSFSTQQNSLPTRSVLTEEREASQLASTLPIAQQTQSATARETVLASATPIKRRLWPKVAAAVLLSLLFSFIAGMAALYYLQTKFGNSAATQTPQASPTPAVASLQPQAASSPTPAPEASPETTTDSTSPEVTSPPTTNNTSSIPPPPVTPPTATTSNNTAQSAAPSQNANQGASKKVEYQNFTFELVECRMSTPGVVVCNMIVTNKDEDRKLGLYTRVPGGRTTQIFDNNGNAYAAVETQIANNTSRNTSPPVAVMLLISNVPTRATIRFEGVSSQATKITRLNTVWAKGAESFEVPLRDINIKR